MRRMKRVYVILESGKVANNYAAEIVLEPEAIDWHENMLVSSRRHTCFGWRGHFRQGRMTVDPQHDKAVCTFLSNPEVKPKAMLLGVSSVTNVLQNDKITTDEASKTAWQEATRIGLLKNSKASFAFFLHRFRKSPCSPRKNLLINHDKIRVEYPRFAKRGVIETSTKTFRFSQHRKALLFYDKNHAARLQEFMAAGSKLLHQESQEMFALQTKLDQEKRERIETLNAEHTKKMWALFEKLTKTKGNK